MPSRRTPLAVLTTLALLALVPVTAPVAHADGRGARPGTAALDGDPAMDLAPLLERTPAGVTGSDGATYPSAPTVVMGKRGEYFLGLEFDYACAFGGEMFAKGMRRLSRLADVIEESGRRAVFTVAPAKSSVLPRRVHNGQLPQGGCTKKGLRDQKVVMDQFRDPQYLPLRRRLMSDHRQVYWKTDPHWTSIGGADFADALADHLSPRLDRYQTHEPSQATFLGLLTQLLGEQVIETAPAVVPGPEVTVSAVPGLPSWVGFPYLVYDHSWTARPASKTWRGRTLLLGDSFSEFAMGSLRPLFRSGRFQWVGHVPEDDVVQAIADSRTVVIETYQLAVPTHELGQKSFIRKVRRALGVRK